jgi:hypothetical protein
MPHADTVAAVRIACQSFESAIRAARGRGSHFDYAWPFANNGLARVEVKDKWGYINEKGEEVIPPRFDEADSFAANGLAAVRAGVNGVTSGRGRQGDGPGDWQAMHNGGASTHHLWCLACIRHSLACRECRIVASATKCCLCEGFTTKSHPPG